MPVSEGLILTTPDDLDRTLDVDFSYRSDHTLSVFVALTVVYGFPLWTKYGIHLRDGGNRTVFRYDNTPHHPDLETFPDHKHVGRRDRPIAHARPALARLVREIRDAVEVRPSG